ncbi:uncharacterized protein BJ212DRAFT_1304616 [Suillus subaureus]|uniref:Uncharacterized protein n=1 Tax=Suillus subaureus TaxID=48587 RepID=A0A9P7DU88_9AGAM|nr:uncharacterized protein BJ212DRAFT_1304616 [Suillus subaureus]KAG1803290.1 hypothetical protein BJ212DRAFT_1304616 [Suillus subaureus]
MAECFEITKVVNGCKEKTYGVRDEYRVTGHVARIMLDNIDMKQIDDVNVLALMGINAKAQWDRVVGQMDAWQGHESELEDCPLGWTPIWMQLRTAIAHLPAMIMRPWTWLPKLFNGLLSVGHLIMIFTRHMWLMLMPEWSTLWEGDEYIMEFHRMMKLMEVDQQAVLKQGLCEVFSDLHLPASGIRMWMQKHDTIVFTTNPAFYRIDCVGQGVESQRKAPKACRTMKLIRGKCIFAADLMDSQLFNTDENLRRKTERQKCWEIQKKMTMVKRNKPFPMDTTASVEQDEEMDVD